MEIIAPDWLSKRGGSLRRLPTGQSFAVIIDGKPLYELTPVPASGKHSCDVMQTNNGRRLESQTVYQNADDALLGGLEDLRKSLGW